MNKIIFDFDQTLYNIKTDWKLLKEEINQLLEFNQLPAISTKLFEHLYTAFLSMPNHPLIPRISQLISSFEESGIRTGNPLPLFEDVKLITKLSHAPMIIYTQNTQTVVKKFFIKQSINNVKVIGRLSNSFLPKNHQKYIITFNHFLNKNHNVAQLTFVGDSQVDAEIAAKLNAKFIRANNNTEIFNYHKLTFTH